MKKVLSLVLALMMVVGMTTVAFAATPKVPSGYKIAGFNEGWDGSDNGWDKGWSSGSNINGQSQGYQTIDKKDEFKLVAGMFEWQDKKGNDLDWVARGGADPDKDDLVIKDGEGNILFEATDLVRSSHLGNVGVRRTYQKGTSGTIKNVELKASDSKVEVSTVEYFAKTGSTDVELSIALTYKGKVSDHFYYDYNFTMENETEELDEDQDEAYSHGNIVIKAGYTTRNVEFEGDVDGIVFATKTVVKGQKYYFNVSTKLEKEDELIIAENPEVDSIYNVRQVNMANATVEFKNLDREFFVYDGEGKLLGTTKDTKLPLASKYILTTAKVDFGGEEPVEEPVEEPTEPEAPPMGGGEVEAPVNNYNPNTGL